jgi:hypothetical protein
MSKPILLDLFSGAGGCAKGYQQAGFYVVGVDINPQPHYCGDEFIQADALEYLDTADLSQFSAIHASPVCKGYTNLNSTGKEHHLLLIPDVMRRLKRIGKPWIIENVQGAVSELPGSLMLCGTMFGLQVERHRFFESSHMLFAPGPCRHRNGCIGVYGGSVWDESHTGTTRKDGRIRPAIVPWQEGARAMDIDWMEHEELTQAIPPAYTAWIGQFLMQVIIRNECEVVM